MITDELIKFVREQLTANVPKEQIIAALKSSGWTEANIAEAFRAVQTPEPPVSSMPTFAAQPAVEPNAAVPTSKENVAAQQPSVVSSGINLPHTPAAADILSGTQIKTEPATTFQFPTAGSAVRTSHKKLPIIIASVLFLIVLAGAGVWFFLYRNKASVAEPQLEQSLPRVERTQSAESPLLTSPFDADLTVVWTKIPDEQNSAAAIAAAGAMITKPDSDFLSKYFGKGYDVNNLPPLAEATSVAARNVKTLQAFFAASTTVSYQCSLVMTPAQCGSVSVRNLGKLLLLRSYVLEKAGKIPEALSVVVGHVDLGRKVTAGADDFRPTLVGWVLQNEGYQRITLLNTKLPAPFSISAAEKINRINTLRDEQKKVFKFMYTREVEGLEYLADKNNIPSFPQSEEDIATADEYRKSIALGKFNLEETKKYFYDSYKTAIGNVDVACGGPMAKAPYDFGSEVNTATTTGNQSSIENYVGKILYWTTFAQLDNLNTKRCEVEALINKL